MLVKKLMANLVSRGLSLGINPSHASAMVASLVLNKSWENLIKYSSQWNIPLNQFSHPEKLCQFLEQNLDEDSGTGGGVVFIQFDHLKHFPTNSICVEEVREELGNVPQFPSLQSVDSVVGVNEDLHEWFLISFVHLAEPLTHQSKELLISSLLSAAINDHVTQLSF